MAKPKTALITGAARRVGRAMALSLAEAGWDVVIHYNASAEPARELATLIKRKGRKACLVQADLKNEKDVARIFPALKKQGVVPDCLINNASGFEKDSLANLSGDCWHAMMDVNLFAPLLLMRDFAACYRGREGNIINITDGLAGWSMSPAFLSYTLSKQGLAHATRMLASELAPRIRVNAIAAGATPMHAHDSQKTFAKLEKVIPLRRVSSPAEICGAMHYVLSSPSLTGQILSLAGGMGGSL